MPQKRNPVAVEHLRLLCSLAAGRAGATLAVLHNTPFTDVNDAEGEVQVAGYAAFEAGGRALRLLAGFIRAARVDEARVRRHIDESCITATELADSLVRAEGISFRQAHEVVSRLVRGMLERGERFPTVPYAAFAEAFAAVAGRAAPARGGGSPPLHDARALRRRAHAAGRPGAGPARGEPRPLPERARRGPGLARRATGRGSRASTAGWPSARAPSGPAAGRAVRAAVRPDVPAAHRRLPQASVGHLRPVLDRDPPVRQRHLGGRVAPRPSRRAARRRPARPGA